ncbi:MAG TPA: hypothetical protein VJK04_04040 [Candidatus Paceibacterota bacterium]
MEDDTLQGIHYCDCSMPTPRSSEMKFFRPSHDLSVLVCTQCCLRVEFHGLPRKDFNKLFLKIEKYLERRMKLFWPKQPSFLDSDILSDNIMLRVNEFVVFGERLEAWHCYDKNIVVFQGTEVRRIKMGVRNVSNSQVALHCPKCGFDVQFPFSYNMTSQDVGKSLRKALDAKQSK